MKKALKASDLNCYICFFGTTIKDHTEIEIFTRSKSRFPTPSAAREKSTYRKTTHNFLKFEQ